MLPFILNWSLAVTKPEETSEGGGLGLGFWG